MDGSLPGYARVRLRPGASRTLFETAAILLAAHTTLLVFHPEATLLSNLFSSTLLALATILACLLLVAKATRRGHCGSCSEPPFWPRLVSWD